jgi:hypothetical protein
VVETASAARRKESRCTRSCGLLPELLERGRVQRPESLAKPGSRLLPDVVLVAAMMFPILKRQKEALAIGYVIFRGALETSAYVALAICWLLLVVVAGQHADSGAAVASQSSRPGILLVDARDQIAAVLDIVFSLGALMLYYVLYRARLIPRWISGWGIVAAVLYLAGGLIDMFGTARDILSMPMLPQEMVMAVWLIAKGFSPSTIASASDQQPLVG